MLAPRGGQIQRTAQPDLRRNSRINERVQRFESARLKHARHVLLIWTKMPLDEPIRPGKEIWRRQHCLRHRLKLFTERRKASVLTHTKFANRLLFRQALFRACPKPAFWSLCRLPLSSPLSNWEKTRVSTKVADKVKFCDKLYLEICPFIQSST